LGGHGSCPGVDRLAVLNQGGAEEKKEITEKGKSREEVGNPCQLRAWGTRVKGPDWVQKRMVEKP